MQICSKADTRKDFRRISKVFEFFLVSSLPNRDKFHILRNDGTYRIIVLEKNYLFFKSHYACEVSSVVSQKPLCLRSKRENAPAFSMHLKEMRVTRRVTIVLLVYLSLLVGMSKKTQILYMVCVLHRPLQAKLEDAPLQWSALQLDNLIGSDEIIRISYGRMLACKNHRYVERR